MKFKQTNIEYKFLNAGFLMSAVEFFGDDRNLLNGKLKIVFPIIKIDFKNSSLLTNL